MRPIPFIAAIAIALTILSCSTEPVPIQFGSDICHFCKMTLMEKQFGAELVTKKGKVYKFDDLKCCLQYYHSGYEPVDTYEHLLVIDFAKPGELIDAMNAFYIVSPEIRSPMGGGVAAFESKSSMDSVNKQWKGIYLSWGEVNTQFK